jgi:hypothetical protein
MNSENAIPLKRATLIVVLSWLSMIGVDFLLHGGLLAKLYVQPSPFLLSPEKAFRLIPLGYLSFLLLAVLLVWLMLRMKVQGWRSGFTFGMKLGALVWGALVLGLLSISTASFWLLLGWFLGQTVELGIAGMFAGSGLAGARLSRLFIKVVVLIFFSMLITVILQNAGLAPAIHF